MLCKHCGREIVPVVTIDGQSASGKTTLARGLAEAKGWHVLHSGQLYRALALVLAELGHDTRMHRVTSEELEHVFAHLSIAHGVPGEESLLEWKGASISPAELETEIIGEWASKLAVREEVRSALLFLQRGYLRAPGLIAEGRDMGTVVFPEAILKLFTIASDDDRTVRRADKKDGQTGIIKQMRALIRRDARDADRPIAPLRRPSGAIDIDNSLLSQDAALARALELLENRDLVCLACEPTSQPSINTQHG